MENQNGDGNISRREMLAGTAIAMTALAFTKVTGLEAGPAPQVLTPVVSAGVSFSVNGKMQKLEVDTRTTLLDLLREHLHLTGTKKGCDHGRAAPAQCL